jgi:Protein of unknown function (DUF2752)
LKKQKLYLLLLVACLAGFCWLAISFHSADLSNNDKSICLIKHVTGLPCPSCGVTRSIILFVKGDFKDAMFYNPLGIILLSIMISAPVWIAVDYFWKKESLFNFYRKAEEVIKRKRFAIPAVLLVLTNWMWNIYKGL